MRREKHKVKIETEIFEKYSSDPITWKDIKHIQFEDDDRFNIGYNIDDHGEYYAFITRYVEETDEEFQERMETLRKVEEFSKEQRYNTYIKLKKEFEDEQPR